MYKIQTVMRSYSGKRTEPINMAKTDVRFRGQEKSLPLLAMPGF